MDRHNRPWHEPVLRVELRLPPDLVAEIDEFAQVVNESRAMAMETLTNIALDTLGRARSATSKEHA